MKSLRSLFSLTGQSIGYGFGIFARQFVMIISVAFFTRGLPKDEYGVLAITTSVLALAQNITGPGMLPTLFRLYNDGNDARAKRDILGASQVIYIGYMLLVAVVIWIFAVPIAQYLLTSVEYADIVRMLAILLFSEGPYTLCQAFLRIQVRPIASSLQSLFHIILRMGLSLLLVYQFNMGVNGYWIGQFIGSFIGMAVLLWLVRSMLTLRTTWATLKTVFVYSLNFIPQSFSGWIMREFDNFIIVSMIGLSAVAVYDIGYRIGQFVLLAFTPIATAWPQFIFSRLDDPNAKELQRDALTYVTSFIIVVALGVLIIAPYTLDVLAPEGYSSAMAVIFWSLLAHTFWALNTPYTVGLHIVKKPGYIAAITFTSALLNVVLSLVFIPLYGIIGAAIATFISYSFATIVTLMAGQHFYPIPIDWQRLLRLSTVAFAAMLAVHFINMQTLPTAIDLLLRGLVLLVFTGLLFAVRFISVQEIKSMSEFTRQLVQNRSERKARKRKKQEGPATDVLPGESSV
jgi:O-antigen/teichoic acid export membrane protein